MLYPLRAVSVRRLCRSLPRPPLLLRAVAAKSRWLVLPRLQSDTPGSNHSGGGSGKKNEKNKKDNKSDKSLKADEEKGSGGSGSSTVPPEEENQEDRIVPRAALFVLCMLGVSYVLYYLSKPSGKHTGWSSLIKHAETINRIHLYDHYAQVYLDDCNVYLGLVDDQHTQEKLTQLQTAVTAARTKKASTNTDENKANAKDRAELEVMLKGTPLAETALAALGVFAWVVPFVFFPVFVMILTNSIGKSMATAVDIGKKSQKVKDMVFRVEHTSSTRFYDIAGMKEPKKEITEIVDFLRQPERYTSLGAKIPTGALLLGPPGTGKTLLAKAVAGEGGVGFIPVCGSDFVELYVGMGALRVRQLFEVAKKQRCIVYIDEIDAIGLKRRGAGHGEKQEQEHTLNELLTQLDGFSTGNRGDIMVLASSNVDQEQLDSALIRPGRFDRIIHVDAPVISERVDIFKVHLSHLKLVDKDAEAAHTREQCAEELDKNCEPVNPKAPSLPEVKETALSVSSLQSELDKERQESTEPHAAFDFRTLLASKSEHERALINAYAERMSQLCPGFVGADIANVCNEGAILAAREQCRTVDITHLERSIDRVLAGIEHRSRVLTPFERTVVAHHEAGHAVAGWFLNRADPLMKVSIVPRGGSALGYAQYLPNENRLRTATEIRDSISVTLGGRVAEEIFFGHLSTGASDDLRKVTQMAYSYVSSFASRPVYPAPGSAGTRILKPFGANVSNNLDVEAKKLVDEIYKETYNLLLSKKEQMLALAQFLLKNEVLTYEDVVRLLGIRDSRESDRKKGV